MANDNVLLNGIHDVAYATRLTETKDVGYGRLRDEIGLMCRMGRCVSLISGLLSCRDSLPRTHP